jgi:hypothetical protein
LTAEEVAGWVARARWRAGPGTPAVALAALVGAAHAALASGAAPRRVGRRKALFALALDGGTPDHLLKAERHAEAPLARRLGRGEAAHQLARAAAAAARGVPTPLPRGAGTVRRRGLLEASLLLVPLVPGADDLSGLWDGGGAPPTLRRALAAELGTLVRRMHDAGVDQEDLAPNNFLWRPGGAPPLLAIDFERVRLRRRVAVARRALALARLDRHLAGASASDRLRFLRAYAGADARSWWRAVAIAHGPLAARDLAHLRRTGTRASRRFRPVACEGWSGWARRAVRLEPVLAALACPAAAHPALWITSLGALDARARAEAWAGALVLAQRRVAPPPIALLCRGDACQLVAERVPGALRLAEAAPATARAALPGLLSRLRAFGFAPERLEPAMLALSPRPGGGWRAELLDPRGLRAGWSSAAPDAVRAWAQRLAAERGDDQ